MAFVHAIAPTIMHTPAPYIAPPGGAFLLTWIPEGDDFQQVDWYWAPASTARRPPQTRLLFERRPIPIDDVPADRLEGDELSCEIDLAITDTLSMIANAWKQARRRDPWRMVANVQHVGAGLARLDSLLTHQRLPAFETPVAPFLPDAVPVSLPEQCAAVQHALNALTRMVGKAGRSDQYADAITSMEHRLGDPEN